MAENYDKIDTLHYNPRIAQWGIIENISFLNRGPHVRIVSGYKNTCKQTPFYYRVCLLIEAINCKFLYAKIIIYQNFTRT